MRRHIYLNPYHTHFTFSQENGLRFFTQSFFVFRRGSGERYGYTTYTRILRVYSLRYFFTKLSGCLEQVIGYGFCWSKPVFYV